MLRKERTLKTIHFRKDILLVNLNDIVTLNVLKFDN